MSAATCARCGQPAMKRIRWFVMGRSVPMFDVCGEHLDVEERVAELLNRGRETPQLRVRVSELPERLRLRYSEEGAPQVRDSDRLAVLRLYRSCRERDMRPWEALAYVRAQAERSIAGARRNFAMLDYIDGELQSVVDRWFTESAADAAEVDRFLHRPLLEQLEVSLEAARSRPGSS